MDVSLFELSETFIDNHDHGNKRKWRKVKTRLKTLQPKLPDKTTKRLNKKILKNPKNPE